MNTNTTHRVGVVGGDGIGPEVIAEALKVVRAAGVDLDTVDYDLGGARYLRDGTVLPDEIVDEWRGLDALLLGAVGTPEVPPGVIERGLLLKMRFDLDLYINQRPFTSPRGAPAHDFVVIRENTEGTYAGEGGFLRKGTPHEIATQGSVNTRLGVERCVRYAFELARSRAPPPPDAGAQDQRADLRRRPVGAHLRRGGRRLRRRDHRLQPRRRRLHLLRAVARAVRRDRDRQPLRRHPHRPRRRGIGRHRPGLVGQPQPRPHRAVDVRAGPRLGSRHRRPAEGQPDRRHPVGRHDARVPGRGRRRRPHPQGLRRRRRRSPAAPPRSATRSPTDSD